MEPVKAVAIEIQWRPGDACISYSTCTTFISEAGEIRITFGNSAISNYDNRRPVSVTYTYKLRTNKVTADLFEEFDMLQLKNDELDGFYPEVGSWQLTIFTNGTDMTLKGHLQPKPFGGELAARIVELIEYEEKPWLWF